MEELSKPVEKPREKEPSINMADFRDEIAGLKEKAGKEEVVGSLELLEINPDDLTEEDARMWYKLIANSVTNADIDDGGTYHKDVEKDIKSPNYNSRENFRGLIRQILFSSRLLEQQKQHEKSISKNSNK